MLMTPWHTKFAPHALFARLAHSYLHADVFTTQDLVDIAGRYGRSTFMDAEQLKTRWKKASPTLYKAVPAITEIHDFVWRMDNEQPARQYPVLQVRDLCFKGEYKQQEVVSSPYTVASTAPPESYAAAGNSPGIAVEKVAHLLDMYDCWIPPERRLEVLPPPNIQPAPPPADLDGPVTSQLAQQH